MYACRVSHQVGDSVVDKNGTGPSREKLRSHSWSQVVYVCTSLPYVILTAVLFRWQNEQTKYNGQSSKVKLQENIQENHSLENFGLGVNRLSPYTYSSSLFQNVTGKIFS